MTVKPSGAGGSLLTLAVAVVVGLAASLRREGEPRKTRVAWTVDTPERI